MEEQDGTSVDERPVLSPEEFSELKNMQAQQTFLQSQGYQAYNFLKQIEAQYEEISRNYVLQKEQAQKQLELVEDELATSNRNFQGRFTAIISQFGFDGTEAINIEETEPHYITAVKADAAAASGGSQTDYIPTAESN